MVEPALKSEMGAARAPEPPAWQIELAIDELALVGFPSGDRYRIAFSLERELGRLLSEAVNQERDSSPPFLDRLAANEPERKTAEGGSFVLPAGGSPEIIGRRLAQTLFESIFNG